MDFQDRTDLVDMRALGTSGIHSLADFTMTQLGTSTVMTRGADSITFANTNVSQLTSTDFLFA